MIQLSFPLFYTGLVFFALNTTPITPKVMINYANVAVYIWQYINLTLLHKERQQLSTNDYTTAEFQPTLLHKERLQNYPYITTIT